LNASGVQIFFKSKRENINGFQLANWIVSPIARHVLEPYGINPSFEIFNDKIYGGMESRYGLKIFP
jgi:hypothetical protein